MTRDGLWVNKVLVAVHKKLTKLKTLLAMAMEDCSVWLHSGTGYYSLLISTVHEFVKLVLIKTLKLIQTLEIHFI